MFAAFGFDCTGHIGFFMMVSYSLTGEKNLLAPFDTNQCMDATIESDNRDIYARVHAR